MSTAPLHHEPAPAGSAAEPDEVSEAVAVPQPGTSPRIAILRNPRSHGNRGRPADVGETDTDASIQLIEPPRKADIAPILAELKADGLDCLIISGGDGTVRDILTAGVKVFGDDWPELAVLPRGKTNALTDDLGIPDGWTIADAIAAARSGSRKTRRPMLVRRSGADASPIGAGFIIGAGAFTMGTEAAQDAHRHGAFGGLAVGLTVGWSVLQVLFAGDGNRWRQGSLIKVTTLPDGKPIPYLGPQAKEHRILLVASTLDRLPLGIKAFGKDRPGFKLMLVDHPHRRLFMRAPLIVRGHRSDWLESHGLHQIDVEGIEIELGNQFVLDGEAYPAGTYRIEQGPELSFLVP